MVDNIRNLCSLDPSAVRPEIMLKFLMGNVPYGDYSNGRTSVESGLPGEENAASIYAAGIGTRLAEEKPVQIIPAPTVKTYADSTPQKTSEVHNVETEEPCSQSVIIEDLSEEQQPSLCSLQEESKKTAVVQKPEVECTDLVDSEECVQPADCQELQQCCNKEECQEQTEEHEPKGSPEPAVVQEPEVECTDLVDSMECVQPADCQELQQSCNQEECQEQTEEHEPEDSPELDGCPESEDFHKSAADDKPSPDESNSEEKLYICAGCGETFDVWKFLVRHFIVHGGMKPYQCPDCQKCFTYPSKLTTHRKTHQRQTSHPCPDCGRCFTHHSNLLIHQKTHSGEKPHACPDCGKCFLYKSKLVTHQKTHNGAKPHSCPDCDKSFVYRCKLLVHQESHNGQKPFHCTLCDKGFPRKSSLVIHMRRHTGERPFVCHICSRGFVEHAKLRRHIRVHTGEKPYGCDICGKCFNDSSTLSRHKRMHFPSGIVKQNYHALTLQPTQNQYEELLNTVDITPYIHFLGEPVPNIENISQHLVPEHDQMSNHWNISKHIKSEREDMIDISQLQQPQNESYLKPLHVTQHPNPQTVHQEPQKLQTVHQEPQKVTLDISKHIKSEREDMIDISQLQQPRNENYSKPLHVTQHPNPQTVHQEPQKLQTVHQTPQKETLDISKHMKSEREDMIDFSQHQQPQNESYSKPFHATQHPNPQTVHQEPQKLQTVHQEPQKETLDISKHIKSERGDMIDISQHQQPQNESYSKPLHATQHPNPQTVHQEPQKLQTVHQESQKETLDISKHIKSETGDMIDISQHQQPQNESYSKPLHATQHPNPQTVHQEPQKLQTVHQEPQKETLDISKHIKSEREDMIDISQHQNPQNESYSKPLHATQLLKLQTVHREPQKPQTVHQEPQKETLDISKHIKSEREDMIDISQHQQPRNENYSKPLHVTQTVHQEPQKEHQMRFSDFILNIKREKEDLLPIDQQAEPQLSQVLEWSNRSQPVEMKNIMDIKVEKGLQMETQPKEVMKWSVNGQEVKTQNEFAFDRFGGNQHIQEDVKPMLKWSVGNQRVGNQEEHMPKVPSHGQHLQPIDQPVQKWTVDSQRVEALNEKMCQPLPTSTQSEHKLKCLDCGLRCSSLSQFVNHRRIHRMQRKRRINTVYRSNLLSQVPTAVRLGGLNHISQNMALKSQGLNTNKTTYHVNEFDVSKRECRLGVGLQALQQGYYVADPIKAQVANDIQVVQLE
ncbi:uncharacterized protein [Hyperolius riggenbachi]